MGRLTLLRSVIINLNAEYRYARFGIIFPYLAPNPEPQDTDRK